MRTLSACSSVFLTTPSALLDVSIHTLIHSNVERASIRLQYHHDRHPHHHHHQMLVFLVDFIDFFFPLFWFARKISDDRIKRKSSIYRHEGWLLLLIPKDLFFLFMLYDISTMLLWCYFPLFKTSTLYKARIRSRTSLLLFVALLHPLCSI